MRNIRLIFPMVGTKDLVPWFNGLIIYSTCTEYTMFILLELRACPIPGLYTKGHANTVPTVSHHARA